MFEAGHDTRGMKIVKNCDLGASNDRAIQKCRKLLMNLIHGMLQRYNIINVQSLVCPCPKLLEITHHQACFPIRFFHSLVPSNAHSHLGTIVAK